MICFDIFKILKAKKYETKQEKKKTAPKQQLSLSFCLTFHVTLHNLACWTQAVSQLRESSVAPQAADVAI